MQAFGSLIKSNVANWLFFRRMLQGTAGEASHPGSTNAGSEMDQHFLQGILDIKTMKVLHLQRGDGEDKSYVFCPAYI